MRMGWRGGRAGEEVWMQLEHGEADWQVQVADECRYRRSDRDYARID